MIVFSYQNTGRTNKAETDARILESVEKFCRRIEMPFSPSVQVLRTEYGKPYLVGLPLHIGVTHAGDILLVGVSRKPFGIDAEPRDRKPKNHNRIVNRYFTPQEQEKAMRRPKEEQAQKFLSLWVRKEAWLKFRGLGLSELSLADTMNAEGIFIKVPHETLIIYVYSEQEVKTITLL